MAQVNLKGVFTVTAKGRRYYYAWRGGPRLKGKPGSPEFMASYTEAHADLRTADDSRVRGLVTAYKMSATYERLAPSTKRAWAGWLDRIVHHFGDLRVAQFDRPDKIRPLIRRWRSQWEDKPRAADYGVQVLSHIMSFAVETDRIGANPCHGIKSLYTVDRSGLIWSDEDIAALKAVASPEVGYVVDLAAYTGLRAGDLKRLAWSHVGADAIRITTSKSRHKTVATIPLYADLRSLLATIPKRSTVVLTNEHGRPWQRVNSTPFMTAKAKALGDRDLHFHDLRGTAATRFHRAGLAVNDIADILGWQEASVEKILRRYVGVEARVQSMIAKINKAERGT
ncbi:Phage integrase family protein [compost metagenome]